MTRRRALERRPTPRRLVAVASLELARRHALETTGELPIPGQGGRHRPAPGRRPFRLEDGTAA